MDKTIINKVLSGVASEKEAMDVADWFSSAEGQLQVSEMLDADFDTLVPHCDEQRDSLHIYKKRRVWWSVASVAVIVLILGVIGVNVLSNKRQEVQWQTVCANRGEQIQVVLQDGTHIYLNAESRLVFPSKFDLNNRQVTLLGEAYFEVQKEKHRPFLVDLNGVSVEVLGTRFNVCAYENELVNVSLDEGHVLFHGEKQEVDMRPGEQLQYDRRTCQSTLRKNVNTGTASSWKEHRLEISEMAMEDLVRMLERRYDVKVDIKDPQCYDYRYSLSVKDGNLRNVLKRMSYVSPICYRYDEDTQYVSIRLSK